MSQRVLRAGVALQCRNAMRAGLLEICDAPRIGGDDAHQ